MSEVVGTALIAALAALGGVGLGGWFDRRTRREEARAAFQRGTLIDLQDTLEGYVHAVYAIHLWQTGPETWAELIASLPGLPEWVRSTSLTEFDREANDKWLERGGYHKAYTDARFRLERLASRVDDAQVRGWMAELIEVGKPVLTEPVLERTLEINVKLNERVGRLIRGESP